MNTAKLKALDAILGIALLLAAANWAAVHWWGYPFLYCWMLPAIWPLYEGWANVVNVLAILYFLWRMIRGDIGGAIIAAFIVLAVIGIPVFAATIFKLGGSCG